MSPRPLQIVDQMGPLRRGACKGTHGAIDPRIREARMHGYQFYEDVERPYGGSAGEIIAVRLTEECFIQEGGICYPALQSKPEPESGVDRVLSTFFNVEYLGAHCRPVTEERAREVNPVLFKYLDGLA